MIGDLLTELRQPLTQNSLTLLFARLNQRAGLAPRPVRPAMLRDTSAIRFLQAGGDLSMLQEQLGLANPVSVRRYQCFVTSTRERRQEVRLILMDKTCLHDQPGKVRATIGRQEDDDE